MLASVNFQFVELWRRDLYFLHESQGIYVVVELLLFVVVVF